LRDYVRRIQNGYGKNKNKIKRVFRESKELIERATQEDFSDSQGTRQYIRAIILGHQL